MFEDADIPGPQAKRFFATIYGRYGHAGIGLISMGWLEYTPEDKLGSIIYEDTDRTISFALIVFEDLLSEGCEFRVPERSSRPSYIRNAVWVLRLFTVNLCIDLINMNYCLRRYKFPDANLYCYYSSKLYGVHIETRDLCLAASTLDWAVADGDLIEQKYTFTVIIESLDLIASSTYEHPSRRAPDVFNQFASDLKATAVQMRQFIQAVYIVACKSTDSEIEGTAFAEMNAGVMDIGDVRIEPIGNAYAQLITSEKHLLEVQRANELQNPVTSEFEPPPPYCSSDEASPNVMEND